MTLAGANRTALVDGAGPDADALRALLTREGWELRADAPVEVAFVDPWTPAKAPWVAALRNGGTRITCLADLVLERATLPVVAITGTAGKSTTAWIARSLLTSAGTVVHAAESATGQLWPTCELLGADEGVVVAELTSSHLCFMTRSPSVAVVTSFWPDHVELHGSVAAYREAKERIARFQTADDVLVLPRDADGPSWLRGVGAGRRAWFAEAPLPSSIGDGVFTQVGVAVARVDGRDVEIGPITLRGVARRAALAAAAAVICTGVEPAMLADALAAPQLPPHRARPVGEVAGVPVVDDTMAATPAKTRATLALFDDQSVVLVAGGRSTSEGGPVHAAAEEHALLGEACVEARRVARRVITFGDAADRLCGALAGASIEVVETLGQALERAFTLARSQPDLAAVIVSPMFPVGQEERPLVSAMAGGEPGRYAPEVENEEER